MGCFSTLAGWRGSCGLTAPPDGIPHHLWGPAAPTVLWGRGVITLLLTPGASGMEQKRREWTGARRRCWGAWYVFLCEAGREMVFVAFSVTLGIQACVCVCVRAHISTST